jgi:hypothetical protein
MENPTSAPLPPNWGRMNEVARTEWLDTHRPDAYRVQAAAEVAQAPMKIAEVVARRDVRAFAEAHQRALDMRSDALRDGTSCAEQDRIERLTAAASDLYSLAWSRARDLAGHQQREREEADRKVEEDHARDAAWVAGETKRRTDRRAGFKAGSDPKATVPARLGIALGPNASDAWLQGFYFARSIA